MKVYQQFKQGIYKPIHPEKYLGTTYPTYRSSYEQKFFLFCDQNEKVVKWSSESLAIPYISPIDGKVHKYFVDNIVHIREGKEIVKYLVEIKPHKQTLPPTVNKKKKKSTMLYEQATYAVNQAKWHAAQEWCKKHDYKWQLITEQELHI